MTMKGEARGPNHFKDPKEIVPGTPTGKEVTRETRRQHPNRWVRVAKALVANLGEWHLVTTYPPEPGVDMVTIAQHTVDRLNRVGLPVQSYQMTTIRRYMLKNIGVDAFINWQVEAKMFQQSDDSVEVWARYTERLAA